MCTKPGAGGPARDRCHKCTRTKLFSVCSPTCVLSCCQSCTFCLKCKRAVTKERRKSLVKSETRNKICQRCFFCRSLRFCPHCSKCPQCCQCSSDRGTSPKILAEVVPPGCKSESSVHFEGRLHSPIQNQTSSGKGSLDSQWLSKPPQEPLPEGGFAGLTAKGGGRDGKGSNISSLLQPTVHSPKTKPKMATNLGPQCSKQIFECKNIQNGNPRNNSDFLATRGMGDIAGFQRRLFPHSSSCEVHFQNQSYQFRALPFGLSTAPMEFTCVVKEVKLMAQSRGIRIHQDLDDWLIRAPTKESCHRGTQSLLNLCKELGWIVNLQKSELEPKQIFEFVGYKYDLSQGLVLPTQNRWEAILQKLESILSKPGCRVREFMSLIGLLTATEKQVPLGRLHMRPIQWHLKQHWRVPESLEKEIPVPRSLHPHLLWWTKETNVLTGQPLHPLSHAVQIFTDASKEGWGAHLGDFTARGVWSVPESHLHINFLELKAVLLALKRFQHLVQGKVVLVATDNTTVVAYINKEGGMRSGSLCALLW